MADTVMYTEDWHTLPWDKYQRNVFRLQQRIYRAESQCGLCFMTEDVMEVHHIDGNRQNYRSDKLALLHGHCHDKVHGQGTTDKVPYDRGAV